MHGVRGTAVVRRVDSALQDALALVRRARDVALQGLSTGPEGGPDHGAYAVQVEQLTAEVEALVGVGHLDDALLGGGAGLAELRALAHGLRAGDPAAIRHGITAVSTVAERWTAALADVRARAERLERVGRAAEDSRRGLTAPDEEQPAALIDLQLQESAYRAAIVAAERAVPASLVDFLR